MTPSWYDVLGVDPDADTDEIRASWRAQVADLDPTDRRFRLLNQAAEVLLDPDRRRQHDAQLAAESEEEAEADRAATTTEPGADLLGPSTDLADAPGPYDAASARRRPGVLLTSILGVVAVLMVIAATLSVLSGGSTDTAASSSDLPDAREVAAARAAAEAAVVPVLSYDYRQLEQGKQAALSYMTPKYAAEYEQLFESVIAVNAPSTETVVNVDVLASGIVRTGPDLVDVLLFVNRPTTNKQQTTPEIYKDQATLRMRDIDGEWLVDCVISGAGSTCED